MVNWLAMARMARRAARAANHVRGEFTADVGLAVAADETRDGQSSGTVHMHLAIADGQHAEAVVLPGDRARFRNYAVINVLNFLRKTLTGP
ncbi:MAG: CinA family protein [Alphaproteobacteria bacterium]|nr:CinA family protein [Alphaproteobacteria bacterium]